MSTVPNFSTRFGFSALLSRLVQTLKRRTNPVTNGFGLTYLLSQQTRVRKELDSHSVTTLEKIRELAEINEAIRELRGNTSDAPIWDSFPSVTGTSDMDWNI